MATENWDFTQSSGDFGLLIPLEKQAKEEQQSPSWPGYLILLVKKK
jgi:hypothetical protein